MVRRVAAAAAVGPHHRWVSTDLFGHERPPGSSWPWRAGHAPSACPPAAGRPPRPASTRSSRSWRAVDPRASFHHDLLGHTSTRSGARL